MAQAAALPPLAPPKIARPDDPVGRGGEQYKFVTAVNSPFRKGARGIWPLGATHFHPARA